MRATLDWSYALLGERERMVLRRLSRFRGPFTLEAATSAVAYADITASDFMAGLAELVLKSLVGKEDHRGSRQYALLDTTRAYALEKLSEGGERERVAHLHADGITRICSNG
jgi:predicted ATPase